MSLFKKDSYYGSFSIGFSRNHKQYFSNTEIISDVSNTEGLNHNLSGKHPLSPLADRAKNILIKPFPNDNEINEFCNLFVEVSKLPGQVLNPYMNHQLDYNVSLVSVTLKAELRT